MNVFAAAESDLALRIRRSLGGAAGRMGGQSRLFAATSLIALCTVALPSCDGDKSTAVDTIRADGAEVSSTVLKAQTESDDGASVARGDGVDWRGAMATDPDQWSDELKAQIVAAGHDLEETADGIRQRRAWRAAMGTEPDEWSEELKAQLLAQQPGRTIEEIAEGVRQRQQASSDLDAIGRRIRSAVAAGEMTEEEARQEWEAIRRRLATRERASDADDGIDWETVRATPPEEWPEELQTQLVAAGHDPETIAERVRLGQRSRRQSSELDAIGRRIRLAIQNGVITPEEGRERMAAARERLGANGDGDQDPRLDNFRRGVAERAMAAPPEEWSDELKAAIERAGWDLDEFTEAIRQRQAARDARE